MGTTEWRGSDYAWAEDVVAVTLAFVRGTGLRDVGGLLGFQWSSERGATFTEASWQQADDSSTNPVQAAEVDDWVVLVEPNGFLASLPGTLAALSRGGIAVGLFWNVNLHMSVTVARDGAIVRSFDPLLSGAGAQGEPLPEEDGLPFGPEGAARPAALELAERLTGVRIDREWLLEAPHRTWSTTGPETTLRP